MKLVIVESPAKAKTINKYLGSGYEVLASYGHIRDLPSKNGSVEPENDFVMHYETNADSSRQIKAMVDAAKGASELILATDPDREGEAISWHVVEVLREKKAIKPTTKISRVVFNAITKNAVAEGIASPRELDINLINAQQARRALDYLVGFTLSPVLWRKLPGSRSAGRVQSVALRLICERENEIEQFISREYWDIKAKLDKEILARVTHIEGKKLDKFDIVTEADAKRIETKISSQKVTVTEVTEKTVQRWPKPPFTTSTLQQEAARKLGFTAKKTMQLAQKLYEGIGEEGGYITYMRTDGVYVAPEALNSARAVIASEFGEKYVPEKPKFYNSKTKNSQEAHEAIRPTEMSRQPKFVYSKLENDMARLYDLIWKRMMASQMENAIFDQVTFDFETADKFAQLRATGSVVKFDGYLKLYEEGKDDEVDEEDKILPSLKRGESLGVREVLPEQHFTEPPPRYSEASLVKKLEELGIGRPSTYASIISVLQDRNYVLLDKKRFIPESRGRIVTAFLTSFFTQYVEYDYTADLEEKLDEVSEGKIEWKQVLREFWQPFNAKIGEAQGLKITEVLEKLNELLEKFIFPRGRECPTCKTGILGLKLGKFGGFIGCSNYPECKHTAQISYAEEGSEGSSGSLAENKVLGIDAVTGREVTIKKGPYGLYVELAADGDEKPKRFSIPKNIDAFELTLEKALQYLSLPREVGAHPETGKMIKAGMGRFGPYLQYDGKYASLKTDDVLDVGINRAVDILAVALEKDKAALIKTFAEYKGKPVELRKGRYGPYIKAGKLNIVIPKKLKAEDLTEEEVLSLIEAKAASDKSKKSGKKKTEKTEEAQKTKKLAAKKPTKKASKK